MIAKDMNGLNLYPGTICIDVTSAWHDEYVVINNVNECYVNCTRVCDNEILAIKSRILKVKYAPYRSALLFKTCLPKEFIEEWNSK